MGSAGAPRLHHAAAMTLWAGSWLTLVGVVLAPRLGWDAAAGHLEGLLAVPVGFRAVGSALVAVRGTPLGAVSLAIDVGLLATLVLGISTELALIGLLASLVATSAIPAWWCVREGRKTAVLGGLGAASALAMVALTASGILPLFLLLGPLVCASVLFGWLAQADIALWALRAWRDERLLVLSDPHL